MSRASLRPRSAYRHWQAISTRWLDNDAYGHVNNAVHYQWFDSTVNAWLIGEGLLDIASSAAIGLVVETGCRYAKSLAYPEPVEVGLAVAALGRSSVTYHLGVFAAGDADAAAEGHFTHVYVDRAARRPTAIPAAARAAMERLKG